MKIRKRSGQSTVEYMMLISVVVIAIVAAAYDRTKDLLAGKAKEV